MVFLQSMHKYVTVINSFSLGLTRGAGFQSSCLSFVLVTFTLYFPLKPGFSVSRVFLIASVYSFPSLPFCKVTLFCLQAAPAPPLYIRGLQRGLDLGAPNLLILASRFCVPRRPATCLSCRNPACLSVTNGKILC